MKEIEIEIGKLFNFLTEKRGYSFKEDELIPLKEHIEIPNENDGWIPIQGLIIKKDDVYHSVFDNGIELDSAAKHRVVTDVEKGTTVFSKDLEGIEIPYLGTRCISSKKIKNNAVVFGMSVDSDKHLYKTPDGLIHHNTHTVMETIYKYFDKSGRPKGGTTLSRMTAVSGSMSKAITAVAAFFYLHRNNELIVFDDCDKVIINDGNEDAANFMKAILDPEALDKPASINLTQAGMKMAQANYSRLRDLEINKAMMNEGVHVKIDMDALREGFFRYSVNGTVRDCVRLTETERLELSNRIREGAFDEYEEVDDFDDGGPTVVEEDEDKMASEFIFNSSVIFISNLRLQDITDAVADRCEQVEISLTLPQFMDRLTSVIPGLFNGKKYSSRPNFMREWAKSAVLVYFKGVIEAYNTHTPLLGKQVYIKRKLTFRLFEEMCNEFCRKAAMYADSHGLGLDDKENQRKIQEKIHTPFLKSFLNKLEMVGGKR